MAFSISDRIAPSIWNVLQSSLYGLITRHIPEGSKIILASPWVVDIENRTYNSQGIMDDLIGMGQRTKLKNLSDFLIALSKEGAEVGLMTAPFNSSHFTKNDPERNRKEEKLLQKLEDGGVEIRLHGESHSKFITSPLMEINMSSNLTNAAFFWHIEQLNMYPPSDGQQFEQARTTNSDLWRQGTPRN